MLPTANNKLLSQWKGPFEVQEKVNDLNYILLIDGHPKRCHINMLDATAGCVRESEYDDDKVRCLELVKAHYSPPQMIDLGALVIIQDDEDGETLLTVSSRQNQCMS